MTFLFTESRSPVFLKNEGREARRRARARRVVLRAESLEERALLAVSALPNTYGLIANTPFQVAAPGVLDNDSDTTATLLHVSNFTQPSHGVLALNTDGSFVYTPVANYFGADSFTYTAEDGVGGTATTTVSLNVAQQGDINACVFAGAQLASVSTTQSDLLNPLLSALLGPGGGVNLTAADWSGLAGLQIDGGQLLGQLQANLGLGSPGQVLSTDITLSELLQAESQVAQAGGNTAQATVLNDLSVSLQPLTGTIKLGDLFQGTLNNGDLAGVTFNTLDLLTGSVQLFNSSNVLATPQPVTLSGGLLTGLGLPASVGSAQLYAQVVEPPVFTCGPAGTQFHTANVRLKFDLNDLVGLNLDTSGLLPPILSLIPGATVTADVNDLGVYLEVGSATGTVQLIDALNNAVTLQATPGLGNLYLGQIADGVYWDRTHQIDPTTDLTLGTIGTFTVTAPSINITAELQLKDFALGQAPLTDTLNFTPPYPQTQTAGSSTTAITSLLNALAPNLELALNGDLGDLQPIVNTLVSGLAAPVISGVITPIVNPLLTDVADPLLQTLGVGVGEAVVTVSDVEQLSAPIANDDFAYSTEGGSATIPVLGNDAFVPGDTLVVSTTSGPAHGTLTVNPDGTITYTPDPGFLGQDSFTYTITDQSNGLASTVSGTVTVNVVPDVAVTPTALPVLTVDSPVSQPLAATGGNGGPYTFAVTAGALPDGLTLDPTTGLISGTPTTAGAYSFTVTATDSVGNAGDQAYSGTVNAAILVTPATQPAATVGSPFQSQEVATGGSGGPYTFAVTAGALPDGLVLDPTTGLITGTPTTAGPYNFTVTATASGGDTGSTPYSGTVNAAILVTPAVLPSATVGTPFLAQEAATGGSGGPYTFAVTAGALPDGLTLDPTTGQISGTPTTAGPYSFTITATASGGDTGSTPYTGAVNPAVAVSPATLPAATVGSPFQSQETATGGSGGPYTFAITAGALPDGLSLDPTTGLISGTPTTTGPYNFTVTATASGGETGSTEYSGTVNAAILVTPATLPTATVGSPLQSQEAATGGSGGPYTFAVTAGALPDGLTLDPVTGLITGTPTTAGAYSFTVTATGTGGDTGSTPYSGTVNAAILVTPATLPSATVGTPFQAQEAASGGSGAPYTFAITAGALPDGLSLDPTTGLISGTPTTAGPYNFTVTATASGGDTGSTPYTGAVNPAVAVSPATLPAATVGSPFQSQEVATGGSGGPYTFAVTAGALPDGLTLDPTTGLISGTPTTAGAYTFTVTATASGGETGSTEYSGTVNTAILVTPATLPITTVGSPFQNQESATGGSGGPYTFAVTAGALPAGLTLDPTTGLITGTPTTAGPYNFTVTATGTGGDTGSTPYSGTVNAAILVTPAVLPPGTVGVPFQSQEAATGGSGGPYTFAVTAGALPAGLTLDATTGLISGTPTTAGPYAFTVTATGSGGDAGSRPYSGTINAAVAVSPAALPAVTVGSPFRTQEAATGGNGGPYTFAITAGALPVGLTLDPASGLISGTPTTAGPYNFTVTATDGLGNSGAQAYSGAVNAAIIVAPAALPVTTVGSPLQGQETATGGSGGPYTFAVTAGALPAGLTLNPTTGQILGIPTTTGPYAFTITATGSGGDTGSTSYTGVVSPVILMNPLVLPPLAVGTSILVQETATGGSGGPYTFAVTAGALPDGLALDPTTGLISGTPTAVSFYQFTLTATGRDGDVGSWSFQGIVNFAAAPPTVLNLQRFGFHAQPTLLVLTFSTALDPVSAGNLSNYNLAMLVRSRRGVSLQPVPLASATYSPDGNTVTLRPTHLLALRQRYVLTVNGTPPAGVAGTTGAFLSGQGADQPGTNYVRVFGPEVLAGRSTPLAPLHRIIPTRAARVLPTALAHGNGLSALAVDAVLASAARLGKLARR